MLSSSREVSVCRKYTLFGPGMWRCASTLNGRKTKLRTIPKNKYVISCAPLRRLGDGFCEAAGEQSKIEI